MLTAPVIVRMPEGVEGWLTLLEAAQRYGVKRDRLERAVWQGRLSGRKVAPGARMPWLVRPEDVETFIRESRRGPKIKPKPD